MNDLVYMCSNGLWHDKPCGYILNPPRNMVTYLASSNNGFFYSALRASLGQMILFRKIERIYNECVQPVAGVLIYRLIKDNNRPEATPPFSLDELVGVLCLQLLSAGKLKANDYYFYGESPWKNNFAPLVFIKAVLGMIYLTFMTVVFKKHRNYVWEKNLTWCYPVVYSVPYSQRYFVDMLADEKTTWLKTKLWNLHKKWTNTRGSAGEKNILYTQCIAIKDNYYFQINIRKNLYEYFGENHPFYRQLVWG